MKKTVLFLLTFLQLAAVCVLPSAAQTQTYNWYCRHVKEHVQPPVGSDVAFVEELDGYYIDHRHADPADTDKVVYLTFDAGYENGNVAKILDALKAEGVSGTFFILQNLILKNPELVKRMVDEGHTVANHTAHHKDMSACSDEAFLKELNALEDVYREHIGGEMAHYYRPPEGKFSRENLVCAQKNGYKTIFWSFAYPDWDNNHQISPEKAKQIILDNIHNGAVILLHPTSATNAAILGDVIQILKNEGYRFGTADELTASAQ